VKIKFLPNWCSSEQGTKRLFEQFYTGQDLTNIEFVHGDEFDVIFYCGYERETVPVGTKKYIFNMEPCWSGNVQRNNSGIDATIFAQDKNIFDDPTKVIECPTYMFYGAGGENWTIEDTKIDYEKTKNISCILSDKRNIYNVSSCLYDKRDDVAQYLMRSNAQVDVFRDCDSPNCVGGLPRKIEGLKPYRFSIGIENSKEQNYISEKFYDPILTNTIPIYYGARNIKEVFPENAYFVIEDLEDLDGITNLLKHINENAEDLYQQMLPELLKIKQRFFNEFNLLTKIIEVTENGV
jgi:hypothetical protein